MSASRGSPLLLSLLLVLAPTPQASGNGINPPRPSAAENITVLCTERDSRKSTMVLRAGLVAELPSREIEIEIGTGVQPPVKRRLSQVTRLTMPTGAASADGFAEASIELADASYSAAGLVRVASGGKPVRLTGFTESQQRVDMPLGACLELRVVAGSAADDSGIKAITAD